MAEEPRPEAVPPPDAPPAAPPDPAPAAPPDPAPPAPRDSASAAPPDPLAASAPERDAALALFKRGMALFRSGDTERAVDLLLESRRTFPSKGNTLNAAIGLEKLGRFDEALALYEEAIAGFGDRLDAGERAALPAVTEALRGKLGALDVFANVADAVVVVDGRERARLPLTSPIRLLPGDHVVRLFRSGYRTFEAHARVELQGKGTLDARLEPLTDAGTLRVEEPTLPSASIFIDGVDVGRAPWEGILPTGDHVVWSRGGDRGSTPTATTVLAGQLALVRLRSAILGAPFEIRARPATAGIRLANGVSLGTGRFQGALPAGSYDVDVEEEGYRSRRIHLDVESDRSLAPLDIALAVDPAHPRWPRRPSGKVLVSAGIGVGLGPGLGSGAEASCPDSCSEHGPAIGSTTFARAGYEFPMRLSVEAGLGYIGVRRSIERSVPGPLQSEYTLRDTVTLSGFAAGVGAAYSLPLVGPVHLVPRLTGGLVLASSRDVVEGTSAVAADTATVQVGDVNASLSSTAIFVYPEVGVMATVGRFRLGGALGALGVLGSGPEYDRTIYCSPSSPACVADDAEAIRSEKAYDPFVLFSLQATATYVL